MKPTLDALSASSGVLPAIKTASDKTGVDFGYLVDAARRESNFNARAQAKTSSAAGLFQFIEETWLRMVKQYGVRHGLGAAAASIESRKDGGLEITDPAAERRILDLRFDPRAAAAMAAEYVAPCNSTQETLAEIWGSILDIALVGINDDFLKLGGDSLLVVRMVSRAK